MRKIKRLVAASAVLLALNSTNVYAKESNFDGYDYIGTGYVTNKVNYIEKIAKVDRYYFVNLRDERFIAGDVYFKWKDYNSGECNTACGYARARFELGNNICGDSNRVLGYGNVEAWSGPCTSFLFSGHVYANCK